MCFFLNSVFLHCYWWNVINSPKVAKWCLPEYHLSRTLCWSGHLLPSQLLYFIVEYKFNRMAMRCSEMLVPDCITQLLQMFQLLTWSFTQWPLSLFIQLGMSFRKYYLIQRLGDIKSCVHYCHHLKLIKYLYSKHWGGLGFVVTLSSLYSKIVILTNFLLPFLCNAPGFAH